MATTRRPFALTATMAIIRMLARLMATTDLIGSMAASLLAPGRGSMAFAGASVSGDAADLDLTDGAEHLGAGLLAANPRLPDEAGLPAAEWLAEAPQAAGSVAAIEVDSPAVVEASTAAADLMAAVASTAAAMVADIGN